MTKRHACRHCGGGSIDMITHEQNCVMNDRRPPWIDWHGLPDQPTIAKGSTIEIRYRDGEEQSRVYKGDSYAIWEHRGDDNDVVAYRVVCTPDKKPILT